MASLDDKDSTKPPAYDDNGKVDVGDASSTTLHQILSVPHTEYLISHANSLYTNYFISTSTSPPGQHLYHIETSSWKNRPDLTLREGSKDGPIAGLASFRWVSGVWIHVGPEGHDGNKFKEALEGSVHMEKTTGSWWKTGKYELAAPYDNPFPEKHVETSTKLYQFQRTQSPTDGVTGLKAKMTWDHWKIMDAETGVVVGMYYDNKCGGDRKLFVTEDGFRGVKREWILLAVAALFEQAKRRDGAVA